MNIKMTDTEHLENLRASLKAAGWRIAKKVMYESLDQCDWYAWQPKRPSDWPDCECNNKPPSLTLTPALLAVDGRTHGSATFSVCGEMGGKWYDLKLYAVPISEAGQTVGRATRSLGAAWQAIAQLEQHE